MPALIVKPSQLKAEIQVPSSKSQTHRAILLGSLAKGKTFVHHPLNSSDSSAMIEACRLLGAKIERFDSHYEIEGTGGKIVGAGDVINAHNSGIVLRFISGIAALGSQPIIITGDHSIRHQRSMVSLLKSLNELGAKAISTRDNGFAPLIIQGPLKNRFCRVENGRDSQNVSPLLIAAIFLEEMLEIEVNDPGEKPWVDITLDWLKKLGVPYENNAYKRYKVWGKGIYPGFDYTVPGDWSSAAFPIAAALITQSDLTLKNVDMYDLQGDKKIVEIFKQMGANFKLDDKNKTLRVYPVEKLRGVTVDINDCIDAINVLATVACYAEGETRIINAAVAKEKECNRLACLTQELSKMGANIQETADGLLIKGAQLKGSTVFSYGDHRMAMSLAVAGMGAQGETHIQETNCIEKTYPSFVKDFQKLGGKIEEVL